MHSTTPTQQEHDRLERLAEWADVEGPGWEEAFKPGSFGCHELLDRAHWLADLIERSLLNHPSCFQNPEWFALADRAASALCELYQRVGDAHLGDDNGERPNYSVDSGKDHPG